MVIMLHYQTPPFFAYFFFVFSKVFDNYAVTVMIGGEPYTLGLFDTAGKLVFESLSVSLFLSHFCQSKKNLKKNVLVLLLF